MTWRGFALLLAALALLAAGAALPALYAAGLATFVVVAALVYADSRRAPRVRAVTVRREHDNLLSVGAVNRLVLHVRSGGGHARVRDECPPAAHPSRTEWRTTLPGTIEYSVTPQRRGELEFGRTVLRIEGPWRLGWRQFAARTEESVHVDADVSAVRVYEALARRGQLAELGVRTLRLRTEGTEFERVREAVPDDPLRAMNWKATARTG
ncbi:MAG: DUF58 domain-containing protein, partial [Candidatus Dormibacteria bacterium]